jgi:hypothetical protein
MGYICIYIYVCVSLSSQLIYYFKKIGASPSPIHIQQPHCLDQMCGFIPYQEGADRRSSMQVIKWITKMMRSGHAVNAD